MAESKEQKNLLKKVKEESEKFDLKFNIQKNKIMASGPITSWQIDGKKWKQWLTLFFWAPKSLWMVIVAIKLKRLTGFPGGSQVKASDCNVEDPGSIPVSGRSPGERNGSPLQYPCLESSRDRGAGTLQSMGSRRVRHS